MFRILTAIFWAAVMASAPFFGLLAGPLELDSFPVKAGDLSAQGSVWKIVLGDRGMFSIEKDGPRTVLHAFSAGHNLCLGKKMPLSLSEFPFLKWSWKAVVLPEGAREDVKKKNDSAAGIIIGMKRGLSFRAIKYVWSSSLAVGSIVQDSPDAYDKVIVLQSGASRIGTWISQKVNLREDIRRCFGDRFSRIEGLSIMTDSDNTHSRAEAFYADIAFSSN